MEKPCLSLKATQHVNGARTVARLTITKLNVSSIPQFVLQHSVLSEPIHEIWFRFPVSSHLKVPLLASALLLGTMTVDKLCNENGVLTSQPEPATEWVGNRQPGQIVGQGGLHKSRKNLHVSRNTWRCQIERFNWNEAEWSKKKKTTYHFLILDSAKNKTGKITQRWRSVVSLHNDQLPNEKSLYKMHVILDRSRQLEDDVCPKANASEIGR